MEESLFLLKTLFEEEDSDFVLNNSQSGLNTDLDLENIFTIISKAENEINIIKEKEKKKNEKEENNKLEKIKLKKLESIQTEYSSTKEDIPQLTKKKNLSNKKIKLFKCICGKAFHTKENQTLHFKNIHLKQKPYKCSFCDCKFSHRNGKTYHERIFHTFILPYKCKYNNCNLAFASKSVLNYHLKNKHNIC
jgi:hypothetical protein